MKKGCKLYSVLRRKSIDFNVEDFSYKILVI